MDNEFLNGLIVSYTKILKELRDIKSKLNNDQISRKNKQSGNLSKMKDKSSLKNVNKTVCANKKESFKAKTEISAQSKHVVIQDKLLDIPENISSVNVQSLEPAKKFKKVQVTKIMINPVKNEKLPNQKYIAKDLGNKTSWKNLYKKPRKATAKKSKIESTNFFTDLGNESF